MIALPIVLYQIWAFIAPGLYQHEKKLVVPLVGSSYFLFLCGMAFAYFVVFPTIFRVMAHYNAPLGAEMTTDIDNYLSFVLTMFLAFGVTFEVPIVVVILARMGFVTIKKLRQIRPYVIVGAFVISAVVTPPDVFSQLILADAADHSLRGGHHCGAVDRRQGQDHGEGSGSRGGRRSGKRIEGFSSRMTGMKQKGQSNVSWNGPFVTALVATTSRSPHSSP